jgi:hypothetical protein
VPRRWLLLDGGRQQRRLGRRRLSLDRPVHDPDQIEDRELEDEHQEDDLDHETILGGALPDLEALDVREPGSEQ